MVYAENGEIVKENERKMMAAGMVGPEGHVLAHPEEAEVSRSYLKANNYFSTTYIMSNLSEFLACPQSHLHLVLSVRSCLKKYWHNGPLSENS